MSTFFGITSDQPFREIVVMNTRPGQGGYIIPSFDDIAFDSVREPTAAFLFGLGLAILTRTHAGDRQAGDSLR